MKLLVVLAAIWFSIETTNSLTYPLFGTKKYSREVASERSDMADSIPKHPVYENGYLTNNGYYYYPHHEYHSYGMPTYRGEYKPKAYYYSSGPSYNHYNDREPLSNPLDDLHEEILQENEQERQTDLLQRNDYEDDYYIYPNEKMHTETTNNFLRNMMEYNRQKEKQQLLQQLYYRQRDELNPETHEEMGEHSIADDDYFSEIEVNPDDYKFEPQGEDNFDLQKYWDAELSSINKGATLTDSHYQAEQENWLTKNQDVKALKSLSKHEPENYDEDNKRYNNKVKQSNLSTWRHLKSSDFYFTEHGKELEDDYSAVDYDGDSWINWDRKRSSFSDKLHMLKINKFKPETESRTHVLSNSQNKKRFFQNEDAESTSIRSKVLPSIDYGQKEKNAMVESNAAMILDTRNEEDSNKKFSKSGIVMENTIYDTIKKMINIEQGLKKESSLKVWFAITNK